MAWPAWDGLLPDLHPAPRNGREQAWADGNEFVLTLADFDLLEPDDDDPDRDPDAEAWAPRRHTRCFHDHVHQDYSELVGVLPARRPAVRRALVDPTPEPGDDDDYDPEPPPTPISW